ncbi:outer membrane protein TolC [Chitinophaga japonensis]|uniref:Outer membrane protein TolC n=2 Tax=Chitinophaga japonensis TaxID=104662 RepID=A0A562TF52_CHIJA|nr:outer membrane protein TolC [Chitinophaga japonensis]
MSRAGKRLCRAAALVCALLGSATVLRAQAVLNAYVQEGLRSNLGLQQMNMDYAKAQWTLKEAKRLYGPQLDIAGSYTGSLRKPFTMPPPDPNDPLSMGLWELIHSMDAPNIDGDKIYYPPPHMFSGGLQLTQTIYSAELKYNRQAKEADSKAWQAKLEDFKTSLEADIRSAYFQYLQAYYVRDATAQGLELAQQHLQGITELIANHKMTKDALYKARANLSNITAQLHSADNDIVKAQYYFNFLLNRERAAPVKIDSAYVFNSHAAYRVAPAQDTGTMHRYQLDYLYHLEQSALAQKNKLAANKWPDVQLSSFAGVRGQEITFDNSQLPFAQLQLSLKWNLFNTGANKARVQQARLQQQSLHTQYDLQQQQLSLQEITARRDVITLLDNYAAVNDSYRNAAVYYEAVKQKFRLGMAGILELSDAENQLLQASINRQVWYYSLQVKTAEYQKSTGKTISIIQ